MTRQLQVSLYNDLKRYLEMNFWKNIAAYRSYWTGETVLRRNEDSLALASTYHWRWYQVHKFKSARFPWHLNYQVFHADVCVRLIAWGRGPAQHRTHARNLDFTAFWGTIWWYSDLHKFDHLGWKYQSKILFCISFSILEWFLIDSVNIKKNDFSWYLKIKGAIWCHLHRSLNLKPMTDSESSWLTLNN